MNRQMILPGIVVWLIAVTVGAGIYLLAARTADHSVARAHNALICVTRKYIEGGRASSAQAAGDKTQPDSVRQRAQLAVRRADDFLEALITIPRSFDCASLLHP